MKPCIEYLPLLSDHVAGALSSSDDARLAAHLAGCAACRAEGEALAEVLSMARLPPPSDAERGALAGLAEAVRLEQRRAHLRRGAPIRYAAALLAVAAAAAFLVAPAFTRRAPRIASGDVTAAQAQDWEAPDTDDYWTASELDADDGSTAAMSGADQVALAELLTDDE